jgi:hypothetical protein
MGQQTRGEKYNTRMFKDFGTFPINLAWILGLEQPRRECYTGGLIQPAVCHAWE